MYYSATYDSPLGPLTLGASERALVGLWMRDHKYRWDRAIGEMRERHDLPIFKYTRDWLDAYFAGQRPAPSLLALAPIGNEFRQMVWQILGKIPYGDLRTYGEIAQAIAARRGMTKMASQAVGGAVGHNPISIIIPCHRVVGKSGSLTGYGGGIQNKVKLLELEGVDMSALFVPTKGTAL